MLARLADDSNKVYALELRRTEHDPMHRFYLEVPAVAQLNQTEAAKSAMSLPLHAAGQVGGVVAGNKHKRQMQA